jgi:hypothetical protein
MIVLLAAFAGCGGTATVDPKSPPEEALASLPEPAGSCAQCSPQIDLVPADIKAHLADGSYKPIGDVSDYEMADELGRPVHVSEGVVGDTDATVTLSCNSACRNPRGGACTQRGCVLNAARNGCTAFTCTGTQCSGGCAFRIVATP